jgi:membrane fusion protein (multidrug efflux system)
MLFKHASLRGSMLLILLTVIIGLQYGCGSSSAEAGAGYGAMPPPQLPVVNVITSPVTTYKEFTASLEGKLNVEVRPQVAGYLDKIYVDEGAYVKQGQPCLKLTTTFITSSWPVQNQACWRHKPICKRPRLRLTA